MLYACYLFYLKFMTLLYVVYRYVKLLTHMSYKNFFHLAGGLKLKVISQLVPSQSKWETSLIIYFDIYI